MDPELRARAEAARGFMPADEGLALYEHAMAVDVEGGVKMDARVRDGHMVVIDGGRFEDGKLVISIEPDYD